MKNLAYSASFESLDKVCSIKAWTKQLAGSQYGRANAPLLDVLERRLCRKRSSVLMDEYRRFSASVSAENCSDGEDGGSDRSDAEGAA